ncbi:hypothetical protein ABS766_15025 [Flavobacterium sp. ST-119]|uniref:DUF2007 domain-containing protein n=2 Tax=Flavobacterium rhizosphaerae TaxID=3163298 RepID=A0ABW8Z2E7_9FLAO
MIPGEAEALQQLLQQNNIGCLVKTISSGLDGNFAGSYDKDYEVRINPLDRAVVDGLVAQKVREDITKLPKDYYLYTFTNEELMEIIHKRDEWNALDYQLSLLLLQERGVEINKETIQLAEKKRIAELKQPEKVSRGWLFAGYLFACMGGLVGVVFGYILYSSKKTLPDGRVMYRYSNADRSHGRIIMIFGLTVIFMLWVLTLVSGD